MNHHRHYRDPYYDDDGSESDPDDIYRKETGRTLNMNHHQWNIDRQLMDRGNYFNIDSTRIKRDIGFSNTRRDGYNSQKRSSSPHRWDDRVGEITGTEFDDIDDIEEVHGMPMRGFVDNSRKIDKYDPFKTTNPVLDFDLFNPSKKPTTDVSYYDPYNEGQPGEKEFSDFRRSETFTPSSNVHFADVSYSVFFSCLYNYFIKSKNFIISPFSLYQGIIMLYLGSENQEIAQLLSLKNIPKPRAYKEITVRLQDIQKTMGTLSSTNFVLLPINLRLNARFMPIMSLYSTVYQYDPAQSASEAVQIGVQLNKITKGHLKESIDEKVLQQGDCIIHSSTIISIDFRQGSIESVKTVFHGKPTRKVNMIQINQGEVWYSGDNDATVIEIPIDSRLVMGIYYNRHNPVPSNDELSHYIQTMSKVKVTMVSFPMINQISQVNYNKFLAHSRQNSLLKGIQLSNLVSNKSLVKISRYYQTVKLTVSASGRETETDLGATSRGLCSIIDSPFIYWVKDIKTNYIITIGSYV